MPGSIFISVVEWVDVAHFLKVYLGKKEFQSIGNESFSFPVISLRDNLVIMICDMEGKLVTKTELRMILIVEKGETEVIFPLEFGKIIKLMLKFILSEKEKEKIREMRNLALKRKHEELIKSTNETSSPGTSSMPGTKDYNKNGTKKVPKRLTETDQTTIKEPKLLTMVKENNTNEEHESLMMVKQEPPIIEENKTLTMVKVNTTIIEYKSPLMVKQDCPISEENKSLTMVKEDNTIEKHKPLTMVKGYMNEENKSRTMVNKGYMNEEKKSLTMVNKGNMSEENKPLTMVNKGYMNEEKKSLTMVNKGNMSEENKSLTLVKEASNTIENHKPLTMVKETSNEKHRSLTMVKEGNKNEENKSLTMVKEANINFEESKSDNLNGENKRKNLQRSSSGTIRKMISAFETNAILQKPGANMGLRSKGQIRKIPSQNSLESISCENEDIKQERNSSQTLSRRSLSSGDLSVETILQNERNFAQIPLINDTIMFISNDKDLPPDFEQGTHFNETIKYVSSLNDDNNDGEENERHEIKCLRNYEKLNKDYSNNYFQIFDMHIPRHLCITTGPKQLRNMIENFNINLPYDEKVKSDGVEEEEENKEIEIKSGSHNKFGNSIFNGLLIDKGARILIVIIACGTIIFNTR